MDKFICTVLGISFLLVAGCGSADQPEQTQAEPQSAAQEEGVFDPMVGTMDRAGSVNDAASARKEEMDRQLEGQ